MKNRTAINGKSHVRDYRFMFADGSSQQVVQLFIGGKAAAFLEYPKARKLADQIIAACQAHESGESNK
jgi:hypothetical protein